MSFSSATSVSSASLVVGGYAVAYGLKGFGRHKHLRVRIERLEGSYAWVRTTSLHDAGTALVLDVSQLEAEWEWTDEPALMHPTALVCSV
jgi:hypothetical protein